MSKFAELRSRLLFLLFAIVVFRLGAHITIPGVDPLAAVALFNQNSGGILDLFNMFGGGALERMSIFALGVAPYISASIIMQLLSHIVPSLEQLRKEGTSGRRKITTYTRFGTLVLATVQATAVCFLLREQSAGNLPLVYLPDFQFLVVASITLVAGTMFLMWLGEQITEHGVGNGISMLIFAGIVSGLPAAIGGTLELARIGELSYFIVLILFTMVLFVTAFVVFVERGQRRVTVNYAQRQQGRRTYAAQSSHLPLKLNMAGVIPPIFASSIILFPASLGNIVSSSGDFGWLQSVMATLQPGQPVYVFCYAVAIIFFCFFYTSLVFNARETADNLKKSGAFLPGIRPGEQTAKYIDGVLTRLTLVGALYITAVCLLPEFLILFWNVPFYFGGTSLLIIVIVTMDFFAQLQSHLMTQQYDSLMKKVNLRGQGARR